MADVTADERPSYPGLTPEQAGKPGNVSTIANGLLVGGLNVVIDVTLTEADGSPIIVKDPRIHAYSYAAVMKLGTGAPTVNITAIGDGELTLALSGTAGWGTRQLRVLVIG